jgi:hypothetical protein
MRLEARTGVCNGRGPLGKQRKPLVWDGINERALARPSFLRTVA